MNFLNDFDQTLYKTCEPIEQYNSNWFNKNALTSCPLVIQDAMKDWPAYKRWDIQYLRENLGNTMVEITENYSLKTKSILLSDYLNELENNENLNFYLSNWAFGKECKELPEDYSCPEYFFSWFNRIDPAIRPDLRWIFIGPEKTGSYLHVDVHQTSAWNALIKGKKLWLFFAPHEIQYLEKEWPDLLFPKKKDRFTLTQLNIKYHIQKEGEIIFTPNGWPHQVYNLSTTIALTENFVNETNYKNVYESVLESKNNLWIKIMEALMSNYERND